MQLHELKAHPVVKALAYAGFSLIIISFVFFYGWGQSVENREQRDQAFARYRSDDALSFLPWRKWEYIPASEILPARNVVADRKLSLLGPQFASLIDQQGIDKRRFSTDEEAAQQAMDTRLLLEEAGRLGIVVTRDEVDQFIMQSFGNRQSLDAWLQSRNISIDDLRTDLQRSQRALRAQNYIANQSRASLYELWLEYLLVKDKITLDLVAYPVNKFEDKVEATDAELQKYLDENKENFEIPAKRRYAYVKVSKDDLKAKIEPTDDQLKTYYEQNLAGFKQAESVRLEDIVAPIHADQPTTAAQTLITQYQDALTTGGQWGEELVNAIRANHPASQVFFRETDWVDRDQASLAAYGQQYLDRAFSLSNDQISTPVLSPSAVHLIKRLDYKPEGVKPFEDVKNEVAESYKDEKAAEQLKAEAKRLRDDLNSKRSNNMRDFALGVQLEDKLTTEVLTTEAIIPDVGSLVRDRNYLMSLKPGKISGLFETPQFAAVVEVKDEQPKRMPTLDEVREEVTKDVKFQKARDFAKAAAESALNEIQTGAEFAAATNDAPTTTVQTQPFTRGQPINDLGFPLIEFTEQSARVDRGASGLSSYGPSRETPEGYAVWKVVTVESPTKADFRNERRQFESDFLQVKRLTTIEEWLADKRLSVQFELLNQREEEPEEETSPEPEKQTAQAAP